MWIPRIEEEIVETVNRSSLEETSTFDAKREIPAKNKETAKPLTPGLTATDSVQRLKLMAISGVDQQNGRLTANSFFACYGLLQNRAWEKEATIKYRPIWSLARFHVRAFWPEPPFRRVRQKGESTGVLTF